MDEYDYGEDIISLEQGVVPRRPTASQSLFKYISLTNKTSWNYFEETINEGILRGSTAKSLNDPFELDPCIVDDLRPSVIEKIYGNSAWQKRLRTQKDEFIDFNDLDFHRTRAKRYLDHVKRYYRIISFCERSDSPLLWSHYANSYKGACLQFLGRAFKFKQFGLGYVRYAEFRPVFPLSLALEIDVVSAQRTNNGASKLRRESEYMHFYTKASEWSYENEVRLAYNANILKTIDFNKDGLVSVILGPRMEDEDMARIKKIVKESNIPNLTIHTAKLSKSAFSVEALF